MKKAVSMSKECCRFFVLWYSVLVMEKITIIWPHLHEEIKIVIEKIARVT